MRAGDRQILHIDESLRFPAWRAALNILIAPRTTAHDQRVGNIIARPLP